MNRNKTTDTNQASELYELFELCKEVYRRHQFWAGTDMIFGKEVGRDWRIMPLTLRIPKHNRIPLYTSDYLLEKLPPVVQDSYDKKFRHIQMWINGDGEAIACYVEPYDKEFRGAYIAESDSMLKALLKLTIALSEAGELNG